MPEPEKKQGTDPGAALGAIGSLIGGILKDVPYATVQGPGGPYISLSRTLSGQARRDRMIDETSATLGQLQVMKIQEDMAEAAQQAAAFEAVKPQLGQRFGVTPEMATIMGPKGAGSLITNALSSDISHKNQMAEIGERDRLQDENRASSQGFQRGERVASQQFQLDKMNRQAELKAPSGMVVGPMLDMDPKDAANLAPADREALFTLGQKQYEEKLARKRKRFETGLDAKAGRKKDAVVAGVTADFLAEGLKNGMIDPESSLGKKTQMVLTTPGPQFAKKAQLEGLYKEVVEGGATKLTPTAAGDLQKNIISNAQVGASIGRMTESFEPEFLTYLTQGEKALKGFKSRLTAEEYESRLAKAEQFSTQINDAFNAYVQSRTGAAMGVNEIERYRAAFVEPTNSPAVFAARVKALQAAYSAASELDHVILGSGRVDRETMAMAQEQAKMVNSQLLRDLQAANKTEDPDNLSDEEAIKRAKDAGWKP